MSAPASPAELTVGMRASFEVRIDRAMIDAFAQLSGDHHPLHTDDAYGRTTQFGGRIAHGMISGALFSRLVGEHLPGERALYRGQRMTFVRPIRPDTDVVVSGEVIALDLDLSTLTIRTRVEDRHTRELYVEGEADVVLRPDTATPETATASDAMNGRPLAGLRTLVLGGSSGIGAAITRELARRGADVLFSYRNVEVATRLLGELDADPSRQVDAVALDFEAIDGLRERIDEALARFGPIDSIVHTGFGSIPQKTLSRGSFADYEGAFRRAIAPIYEASRAGLPHLQERGGSIVAVSSIVTQEAPPPAWSAYTVAKSALVGLIRSLAVELGPWSIRANLVSPSWCETDANRAAAPRIRDEMIARSPLGRVATPADVARTVAFLVSPESSFITGHDLPVCGGSVMA